jgi:DNA mismatch repair protein MutL
LDAGATDIRIRIKGAGKALIEVADDGCGMSPDDLEIAFRQHATSKISGIEDLNSLKTMGFRGEALSSIAAVSDVELSTKETKATSGSYVKLKNGKITGKGEKGRPDGSTISVQNLFANLPARLKYLKGDRVEVSNVISVVTERALACPEVAFRLHNEEVEVFNYPRASRMLDRITDVMGRKVAREIVEFKKEDSGMKVLGYLAKPSVSRPTAQELHVIINKRPVSSRQVVEKGYAGLLMRNRHPVGVLLIEMNPGQLDVNVHPTKKEIKFVDINIISKIITSAVAGALGNTELIPSAVPLAREEFLGKLAPPKPAKKAAAGAELAASQTHIAGEKPCEDVSQSRMLPRMKIIGQILDTYILCQSGADLVIIDQHAAHERIMLEKVKSSEKKGEQKLITPLPLHLSQKECGMVEHYRELIEEFGFKIEPFGKDTYLVRAVPVIGGHLESEPALMDLIHELAALGKAKSIEEKREEIRHLVACHSAIRAGEKLSQEKMHRLVEEMHGLDNPYTCAHGRPTLIRITEKELERMFKRVV